MMMISSGNHVANSKMVYFHDFFSIFDYISFIISLKETIYHGRFKEGCSKHDRQQLDFDVISFFSLSFFFDMMNLKTGFFQWNKYKVKGLCMIFIITPSNTLPKRETYNGRWFNEHWAWKIRNSSVGELKVLLGQAYCGANLRLFRRERAITALWLRARLCWYRVFMTEHDPQ